jgi:hypothetical protein
MSASEVVDWQDRLVGVSWVAEWYGVPRVAVYRAIRDGRLEAIRAWGKGKSEMFIFDREQLPFEFPR